MSRPYILLTHTDVLRGVSVVLKEDQRKALSDLNESDDEHDLRFETLHRVIDFAKDSLDTLSDLRDDHPVPHDAFLSFNRPLAA